MHYMLASTCEVMHEVKQINLLPILIIVAKVFQSRKLLSRREISLGFTSQDFSILPSAQDSFIGFLVISAKRKAKLVEFHHHRLSRSEHHYFWQLLSSLLSISLY